MTVPIYRNREDYTGNSATTVYPYQFRIFNATNLVVTQADPTGVETTLDLNTDYTVTGAGNYNGGTIVLASALPSGHHLTIERVLPVTQETDLRNQGEFFAETHEDVFDRLVMICQLMGQSLGMSPDGIARALLLGKTDISGSGAYDASSNRIKNLDDPTDDQDATTKKWVNDLVMAAVSDGSGNPIVARLASSAAGDGVDMVANATDERDLADTEDPAKNSGMIAFNPALDYPDGSVGKALNGADDALALKVDKSSNTGVAKIPAGTTAQRPGSPQNGDFRGNTTTGKAEMYIGGSWVEMPSGSAPVPTLAGDMNAIAMSGSYYTDASTTNRINSADFGTVNTIFDHLQIDNNNAMQRAIDYAGNRAFFRSKVGGTWSVWQQISVTQVAASGWPSISDNNALLNDECTSLAAWTNYLGSPSIVGSELVLPSGSQSATYRPISLPSAYDYIIYLKMRVTVGSGFAYLQMNSGGRTGTGRFHFTFGYDWTTGAQASGVISAKELTGGATVKLATGAAYGTAQEYAIHVDRNRGQIMFYRKVSGEWSFEGSLTYNSNISSIDTLLFAHGSSVSPESAIDYFTVSRPNVLAIGDSVCAGATLFDPDPTVYAGVDNYSSTWMKSANIYSALRNNFIVNKGIGSQTSAQILARINEATESSARVVFLQASSNDYGASIDKAVRTNNMQNAINSLRNAGIKVVVLNAIYSNSAHSQYPAEGAYMLDWWNNYRNNLTGVSLFIDIMQPVISGGYISASYAQADGIHPNVAGYGLIGNYIEAQAT